MRARGRAAQAAGFVAGLLCLAGCRDTDSGAAGGAGTKEPARPVLTELPAAALQWTREDAIERLPDQTLAAAVRLVQLAGVDALCVPEELTDEHVRRLRAVKLREGQWALGLRDAGHDDRLRAPVLVTDAGTVSLPAVGVLEEVSTLHVSRDTDLFPHVLLLPDRVLVVGEQVVSAVALKSAEGVLFELRKEGRLSYVALVPLASRDEAARYVWDPYERAFIGPAADRLPDPPGGRFALDMRESKLLVPRGGEIEKPEENVPPPGKPGEREGPVIGDEVASAPVAASRRG